MGRLLSSDGPETVAFEVTVQPRDGEPIVCEDHVGVLPYEGEEFEGSVGVLRDITESREREQELSQTHDLMSEMEQSAHVGAWEYDSASDRLMLTDGARRLHGLDPDADLTLEAAFENFHPDDRDVLEDRFEDCLETGTPYEMDVRLTAADGKDKCITARGERVAHGQSGTVVRGYVQDITERKQMERDLREERDLVRGILETSPVGIAVVTADGDLSLMNDQSNSITGWSNTAVTDTPYDHSQYDLVDEDGDPYEAGDTPFGRVLSQETTIHDQVVGTRSPSGERVWLSVHGAPQYSDDGEIERAVFTYEDITEQRELEAELSEILGRISDGFLALDEEFRVTHVNSRAEALLGAAQAELLGETLWDVAPETEQSDAVWESLRTAMETQTPQSRELHYEPRDSWFDTTVYPSESGLSVYFREVTDRKQREQQLTELKRQYKALAENFPDGVVYLCDTDLRFLRAHGDELRSVGLSPADVTGKTPHDLFPEDIAAELSHYLEEALNGTANTFEQEYRGERYRVQTVPVRADDGEIGHVMSVSRNVTEQTTRRRELERQNDLFGKAQSIADIGAWAHDTETGTLTWTDQVYDIHGVSGDFEPSLDSVQELYHPDDQSKLREMVTRAVTAGEPYDLVVRMTARDDGPRWIRTVADPQIEDGEVVRVRGIVHDITERTRREAEREETNQLLSTLFDTLPVGVTVVDTDGRITRANRRAEDVLGLVKSDILDRTYNDPAWEIRDEDGEQIADEDLPVAQVMRSGDPVFEYEHGIMWPDGSERLLSINSAPITTDSGDIRRVVNVIRDITDARESAEAIRAQNQRLEEFTSIVSHDLRNPLTVAEGHLELAMEARESDHLARAATAIDRSQALIDDLLTLARDGGEVAEVEPVELAAVAQRSWQTAETGAATLDTDTTRAISADRSRLVQLFENLYRNAVEQGGDDVAVSVGATDAGFYVADSGPGIAEADREDVFQAGYSTAEDGTGLGLRIVEEIAAAHGWEIAVSESDQGGARFDITGVEVVER